MPYNEFVAAIRVHGYNQFAHVANRQQINITLRKTESFTSLIASNVSENSSNLMIGGIVSLTLGFVTYIYKSK